MASAPQETKPVEPSNPSEEEEAYYGEEEEGEEDDYEYQDGEEEEGEIVLPDDVIERCWQGRESQGVGVGKCEECQSREVEVWSGWAGGEYYELETYCEDCWNAYDYETQVGLGNFIRIGGKHDALRAPEEAAAKAKEEENAKAKAEAESEGQLDTINFADEHIGLDSYYEPTAEEVEVWLSTPATHFYQVHDLLEYISLFLVPTAESVERDATTAIDFVSTLQTLSLVGKRWYRAVFSLRSLSRLIIAPYGKAQMKKLIGNFKRLSASNSPWRLLHQKGWTRLPGVDQEMKDKIQRELKKTYQPYYDRIEKDVAAGTKTRRLNRQESIQCCFSTLAIIRPVMEVTKQPIFDHFAQQDLFSFARGDKIAVKALIDALRVGVLLSGFWRSYFYRKGDANNGYCYLWVAPDVRGWRRYYREKQRIVGSSALTSAVLSEKRTDDEGSIWLSNDGEVSWQHYLMLHRDDYQRIRAEATERHSSTFKFHSNQK